MLKILQISFNDQLDINYQVYHVSASILYNLKRSEFKGIQRIDIDIYQSDTQKIKIVDSYDYNILVFRVETDYLNKPYESLIQITAEAIENVLHMIFEKNKWDTTKMIKSLLKSKNEKFLTPLRLKSTGNNENIIRATPIVFYSKNLMEFSIEFKIKSTPRKIKLVKLLSSEIIDPTIIYAYFYHKNWNNECFVLSNITNEITIAINPISDTLSVSFNEFNQTEKELKKELEDIGFYETVIWED